MRSGDLQIDIISGGPFRLDGGGMFGIIPKPLWEREHPADERNRIALDTNCVLLRGRGEVVLIDSGNGSKMSAKERDLFDLVPGNPLLDNLAALRVRPEDITAVVFSHLHMDHCGGGTLQEDGEPFPTFPNARHYVQRQEWEDALENRSTMRVSYRPENLLPLRDAGQLELVDGDAEILPGIRVEVTSGHTRGHQAVFIETGEDVFLFMGDLCPTHSHLRSTYNMAYDLYPYENMQRKLALAAQAAREGWTVIFDHDPQLRLARVIADGEGRFRAEAL